MVNLSQQKRLAASVAGVGKRKGESSVDVFERAILVGAERNCGKIDIENIGRQAVRNPKSKLALREARQTRRTLDRIARTEWCMQDGR